VIEGSRAAAGTVAAGTEELRIALALNGGVSLAVWIGGVTTEVERLISGRGAYKELLELTRTAPRVDVISGASAGGLNGALLAMAIAHRTSLAPLRDLWIDKGTLTTLLRDPLQPKAQSLLKGDDFFLPELRKAFRALWNPNPALRRRAQEAPIILSVTTSLLEGKSNKIADDYGTIINDISHKARFVFKRSAEVVQEDDPFWDRAVIDKLALAARCTASFPGAFEASYVPIKETTTNPNRPDMTDHIRPRVHSSRYVVDGGVLDNKPIEGALEAIYSQRSDRNVRRVLAYVVPDPGGEPSGGQGAVLGLEKPPSAAAVAIASLITLPRNESILDELRSIRDQNRKVEEWRHASISLTSLLEPNTIERLARDLFPVYVSVRKDASIRYIVERISATLAAGEQAGLPFRGRREWLYSLFDELSLPWIPDRFAPAREAGESDVGDWKWGTRAIEKIAGTVLDVIRRTQALAALLPDEPPELPGLWRRAFDVVSEIDRLRQVDRTFWGNQARRIVEESHLEEDGEHGLEDMESDATRNVQSALDEWRAQTLRFRIGKLADSSSRTLQEAGEALALELASTLKAARSVIRAALADVETMELRDVERARSDLRKLVEFLHLDAPPARILWQLLTLHVVTASLPGSEPTDQVLELVQVSADTPSTVGPLDLAKEKLTGIQLGHFGAFYRRSWRANDWLHGRLDGAYRLVQIVLSPRRLRVLYGRRHESDEPKSRVVTDLVEDLAWKSVKDDALRETLKQQFPREVVEAELSFIDRPGVPPPETIPTCVEVVARRFQLEILQEELVVLYHAVRRDRQEGAGHHGTSADFAAKFEMAVEGDPAQVRKVDPNTALDLFSGMNIGGEKLRDDVGSDLFSTTVSHGMATAASVANAQGGGVGTFKQATRAVRGPLLLLYLLVRNATRGRAGAALNSALLAGGAIVVGIDLATQGVPGFLVGAGWLALTAGILLVLLRGGIGILRALIPAVVIVGMVVVITVIDDDRTFQDLAVERFPQGLAILVLAALLIYLGALTVPDRHSLIRTRKARRIRLPKSADAQLVKVEVDGVTWTKVDHLSDQMPEGEVFAVDPRTSEVLFGDGKHGKPLPKGAEIAIYLTTASRDDQGTPTRTSY
jgi:patatin-related protein